MLRVEGVDFRPQAFEARRGHIVGLGTQRTLRQRLVCERFVLFLDECTAHWPPRRTDRRAATTRRRHAGRDAWFERRIPTSFRKKTIRQNRTLPPRIPEDISNRRIRHAERRYRCLPEAVFPSWICRCGHDSSETK